MRPLVAVIGTLVAGVACQGTTNVLPRGAYEHGTALIRPEAIQAHVEVLAADSLEGRGTGTPGYARAADYVRSQLEAFGADGGASGGEFFQQVAFVRTRIDEAASQFEVVGPGGTRRLTYRTHYAFTDNHQAPRGSVSSRVVFVGYGVTAPDFGYDDYAGLDVRGAVVAMFEFDAPPTLAPAVRAHFKDHDVKLANAARRGAVAVLYVRSPDEEKMLPWPKMLHEVEGGWTSLRWADSTGAPGVRAPQIGVMAVLSRAGSDVLFAGEQHDAAAVFAGVQKGQPPRFLLNKTVHLQYIGRQERFSSPNVVGVFVGSDPVLKTEYVLYSAHLDHLGIGPVVDGDSIYNGAIDNAGGTAVLLEVARALGQRRPRPRRSVMLAFVTGEEAGLLGSDYLAYHPPVRLAKIVANINVDGGTALTPVSDVIAWGAEHSSLDSVVAQVAARAGLTVSPDPYPGEGMFVRSDQYSFIKQGIPSLYLEVGIKSTLPGVDAMSVVQNWLVTNYHSPKDDLRQAIHYPTSARFAAFVFAVGEAVAMELQPPRWKEQDFFGRAFGRR